MQVNNSPRFIKSFMIGLIASSAGAFVALPSTAMPEPGEAISAAETVETTGEIAPVDAIIEPTAEEALPMPEADTAVEADAEVTEEDAVAEEFAEEDAVMEADADMTEEDTVIEADAETTDADTVEAAEIEALDEEAIEAADTMDGEPVAEDAALDEEIVADDAMETEDAMEADAEMTEEAVEAADTMDGEPVADDAMEIEEPIADDAMEIEEPVADDTTDTEEPVADEDINTEDFTIAELTNNNDSFEVLAAALAAAELTEILGSEGPFTVFAPTDEAFAELPEGAVEQLLLPENKDILVQVLTYHVVPSTMLAADLATGGVSTVEGSEIAVAVGDTITVDNANVVFPDLEASNGVIHVIDRVILPPAPEAEGEVEGTEAVQ